MTNPTGVDDANQPGLLTLAELAKYLHLGERTVLKLARDDQLPGVFVDGQWRFEQASIDRWLEEDGEADVLDGMRVPLGDLLSDKAIIHDLQASDSLGAIEQLAARAYSNRWLTDKPWFVGAVVERESLASTAMAGGVALMHTKLRDKSKIARPFIIIGRSYDGVELGAPDGKPTYLMFLLGLKYDKLHLPILARLARVLRNPVTVAKLRSIPSPQQMRALLLAEDARALENAGEPPEQYEVLKPKLDRKERLRAIMRQDAKRKHKIKKAEEEATKLAVKEEKAAARKAAAKEKAREKAAAKKLAAQQAAEAEKAKKPAATKKATASKAVAKKATTKKATKATTKKATTTKSKAAKKPASKVPAKKTAAKKASSTKAAAKKAPASRSSK